MWKRQRTQPVFMVLNEMSYPFYRYLGRKALEKGVEKAVEKLAQETVVRGGRFIGRAASVAASSAKRMGLGRWLGFTRMQKRLNDYYGATHNGVANAYGFRGNRSARLAASAGRAIIHPRQFGGNGGNRISPRLRHYGRSVPRFGLAGLSAGELDVFNSPYIGRRPRRRAPTRRPTRRLKRVKRFSSKKRIFRRRR